MICKNKYSFIIIPLFFIILGFFLLKGGFIFKRIDQTDNIPFRYVKIGEEMIKIDLARTQAEQEKGLSGREALRENEGMLFIFPKSQRNYFWMKDMNFPIDIIWIDKDFKIIFIKKNAEPSSYPNSFGPSVDNRYVLEVLAGFSEKNNLKIGDRVEFLR